MKKLLGGVILLVIGLVVGSVVDLRQLGGLSSLKPELSNGSQASSSESQEKKILYWVAPMDPTYKRDKPGKSPMGMDLIPVYAQEGGGDDDDSTVRILPAVVNNLGVRTAVVKRQNLERRVDTVGSVGFDETKITHIHLRTDGWVERLLVKSEGEHVEHNQLLFQYYSPALVNAQEEFLQAVSSNNQRLVKASKLRLISLGMSGTQLAELERTKDVAHLVSVYAPQHGIVSRLTIREGMRVKPEMDILTLANLKSVWLQTAVFERQADWIVLGGRAEARLAYLPGEVWKGKVDFIYPTLDPKTRTLMVRLQFDTPDKRMKPNMYAKVAIFAPPKENILTIPREAVIRSGRGERVVMALGDGRFQSRKVRIGMESSGLLEVLSGLEAGETVVTSAQFLIDSQASLKGSLDRMEDPKAGKVADPIVDNAIKGMGVLLATMPEEGKVKLSHGPIPELKWPAMTMNFVLAKGVAMPDWPAQTKVHFELRKVNDLEVEIIYLRRVESAAPVFEATGVLRGVMAEEHKVKIAHDPIVALQWPAMVMSFTLAPGVNQAGLVVGEAVAFNLQKIGEFEYQVIEINSAAMEHTP